MSNTAGPHRRPVELVEHVPVAPGVAAALLKEAPRHLVKCRPGPAASAGEPHTDLAELLAGRHVSRAVRMGFGPLLDDDGAVALPVWWEDAEHPQLFPTFDGGLEVRPNHDGTELRLVGSYRPPLGVFGRFADGLAGHRVVLASLQTLLRDVAEGLVTASPETAGTLDA